MPRLTNDERMSFSISETAKILGVGQWAVREAIKRGELRGVRFRNRILIPRESVERLFGGEGNGD